jgi:hypothetical protein
LGLDQDVSEEVIPGVKSFLPGEDDGKMITLSMIKPYCWGEQVNSKISITGPSGRFLPFFCQQFLYDSAFENDSSDEVLQ